MIEYLSQVVFICSDERSHSQVLQFPGGRGGWRKARDILDSRVGTRAFAYPQSGFKPTVGSSPYLKARGSQGRSPPADHWDDQDRHDLDREAVCPAITVGCDPAPQRSPHVSRLSLITPRYGSGQRLRSPVPERPDTRRQF